MAGHAFTHLHQVVSHLHATAPCVPRARYRALFLEACGYASEQEFRAMLQVDQSSGHYAFHPAFQAALMAPSATPAGMDRIRRFLANQMLAMDCHRIALTSEGLKPALSHLPSVAVSEPVQQALRAWAETQGANGGGRPCPMGATIVQVAPGKGVWGLMGFNVLDDRHDLSFWAGALNQAWARASAEHLATQVDEPDGAGQQRRRM